MTQIGMICPHCEKIVYSPFPVTVEYTRSCYACGKVIFKWVSHFDGEKKEFLIQLSE